MADQITTPLAIPVMRRLSWRVRSQNDMGINTQTSVMIRSKDKWPSLDPISQIKILTLLRRKIKPLEEAMAIHPSNGGESLPCYLT